MIAPQRNMVVVALEPDEPTAPLGGIVVVRDHRQASTYARVEAVGPEVRDVRVGERVIISRLQGIAIGDDRVVVPETAVLARGNDGDATGEA